MLYYWSGSCIQTYVCACISFTIYVCNDSAPCCPEIDTDNWGCTDLTCGLCLTVIQVLYLHKANHNWNEVQKNMQIHLPRLHVLCNRCSSIYIVTYSV